MMKYYYDLLSQPSRAVYIFLTKNKINFQKCPVALRKGEHRNPQYKEVHPFQLVPALDDNGFKLIESVAILRYLARKYEGEIQDFWYPKDLASQCRVDEYMEWQHANTRMNCAMYFQHKLLIPLVAQMPPDKKKIALFQNRMEKTLDAFENVWLKDRAYIAGSHLTMADLLAICELQQPGIVGYDVCQGRPRLADWFNRVKNELQPEFDEASAVVNKVGRFFPLINCWALVSGNICKVFGLSKQNALKKYNII